MVTFDLMMVLDVLLELLLGHSIHAYTCKPRFDATKAIMVYHLGTMKV